MDLLNCVNYAIKGNLWGPLLYEGNNYCKKTIFETCCQICNKPYKMTRSSFCFLNLSLPVSVTKYVSPKFIANCALLSIKIMCIKNTIPGLIINGFPVKIIGGTSIQLGEDHRWDVQPQFLFLLLKK